MQMYKMSYRNQVFLDPCSHPGWKQTRFILKPTISPFVSKFVYVKGHRCWKPRKKGMTIGRLISIPISTQELFYLRMILTVCKGPRNYEEIKTVGNIIYHTFKEVCFVMGFLEDDKEYIEAIKEAKDWGSRYYLRKLKTGALGTIWESYLWQCYYLIAWTDQTEFGNKHGNGSRMEYCFNKDKY